MTDAELAAIWKAADRPCSYNSIVRLLILTGQRREEVAGMIWNEVTNDLSAWTISASRAKNGIAHIVPLSPQAQAILHAARDTREPIPFSRRRGPFNGFGKAKRPWTKPAVSKIGACMTFAVRRPPAFNGSACDSK